MIELPSGKTAEIRVADFQDAMRLQNRLIREAAKEGFKEADIKKLLSGFTSGNIMKSEVDVNALLMAFVGAVTSESVYEALWPCLKKSSYNGEKITPASFDDECSRVDFYPIAVECCKVNIYPFWRHLLSKLDGIESIGK